MQTLTRTEWLHRKELQKQRVGPWVEDRITRRSKGIRDPVFDFLFEYYAFRPAHLLRWSAGINVALEDISDDECAWPELMSSQDNARYIDPALFPQHRIKYLDWAITYLTKCKDRPAHFGCFGLHEWAMVYGTEAVRHSQVPMRLSAAEIDIVVEENGLRCTHFDAFRFFTPQAVPKNSIALTRDATTEYDQSGCVHVTMDLYKFAHKIAPWCSSELIADGFLLACESRKLDMRASPYDLSASGYDPICIETREGKEIYVAEQRRLSAAGEPIRMRLLETYTELLELVSTSLFAPSFISIQD